MKWTVENNTGSEARMEARRAYPNGLNARVITLRATRHAVAAAERRIGTIARVRLGSSRPFLTMPVEIIIDEAPRPIRANKGRKQIGVLQYALRLKY